MAKQLFKSKQEALRSEAEKFKGSEIAASGHAPILPNFLVASAFLISFCVPNLVFSGRHFFDTLHIMKWTVTMVPIGVLALVAGFRLVMGSPKRYSFFLDPFSLAWLLLVALVTLQPLYINISSMSTFVKEWFYFASLFAVYVAARNSLIQKKLFRAILLGGSLNAAINVIFAEMLIRGMNSGIPFILDVPGNYIGNTAQQEMFGLWMAMAILNGLFIHLDNVDRLKEGERAVTKWHVWVNLIVLAVNAWGLWSSTTRGAILSLIVAFIMMTLCLWCSRKTRALSAAIKIIALVAVFVAIVLAASSVLGTGRGSALISKMGDMINNPTSVGSRISIWRTSWEAFRKEPVTGVGLGQYKWHFLDAQRIMYEKSPELYEHPDYSWQFTYWAHSEYIQWLAESGIIGAAILLLMGLWWLWSVVRDLVRRKDLPPEAVWGIAMTFLLWFDALFSRPFHRIENSVWMALAFAMSNAAIMPKTLDCVERVGERVYKLFGVVFAAAAMYGFYFLAGGIIGDQEIYAAIAKPGTALEKQEHLKNAEAHLMSRDDAEEQMANLIVSVGRAQENKDTLRAGLKALYAAYTRQPTAKLLFDTINLAQELGDQEMLRELVKYLSPSMYRVQSPKPASE